MLSRALLAPVILCSCLPADEPSSDIVGSPSDVTTAPGAYTGYRVVTACPNGWADVGVIGTGALRPATTNEIAAAVRDLYAQISHIDSVWGWGGPSLGCEDGVGASIDLDNWRDVDALVVEVGAWLHARDLQLQVSVSVGSVPVPHR